jgi:hypothetical protein
MEDKLCEQEKCALKKTGLCPPCICGCSPNIVSDFCEQCWCCQHEAGFVRGGIAMKEAEQKVGVIIIEPQMESDIK